MKDADTDFLSLLYRIAAVELGMTEDRLRQDVRQGTGEIRIKEPPPPRPRQRRPAPPIDPTREDFGDPFSLDEM